MSSDYKDISVHLPISCLAVKLSDLLAFKDHLSASDVEAFLTQNFIVGCQL